MRMPRVISLIVSTLLVLLVSGPAAAAKSSKDKQPEIVDHNDMMMDHGNGHLMDMDGAMVMGQNKDKLPGSCTRIMENVEFTVHAGRKYAEKFPGRMLAFEQQEWHVKPCAKVTIHFINEDNIRHQWMMHGLPKYLYKGGMFHLEVTGPGKVSGTFIVPANDQTYLVHCDISQHMEKGMKAQLVVGKGGADLPSVPGVTPLAFPDNYEYKLPPQPIANGVTPLPSPKASTPLISGMMVIGLAFGLLTTPVVASRLKGMTAKQAAENSVDVCKRGLDIAMRLAEQAVATIKSLIQKYSP